MSMKNLDTLSPKEYFHLVLNEGILDSLLKAQIQAEQKLSQPHQYIEWLDALPFRVLHHPLGATPEHVAGMLATDLIKQENIYPVGIDGRIIWKYEKSREIPHVFQYQIQNDAQLAVIVTDLVELARIREAAKTGWGSYQYPTISLMNPPALQQWADYMGKRLSVDNQEQTRIFETLSWGNVEEQVTNGGIPLLGVLNADNAQVVHVGRASRLVASAPYRVGFDALWLYRGNRVVVGDWIAYDGASALLLEDKTVPA